ncbi:MAG: hypothetical protein D6814_15495 [Calditrichaeota bacterium]|nr:MAG: hypothetical protein D6814_15495 [Calditrichota bacterium]
MSDSHVAEIQRHVRVYVTVFVSLAILTLVTVGVSYLHLPVAQAIAVALTIATIKGGLVASYFMHLISEKKLIYGILILTVIFFLAMMFLLVGAYHDQMGGFGA